MIIALLFLCFFCSLGSQPLWSTYPSNVMYSGEYHAFLTPKGTGLLPTFTQPMYRADVPVANYFTTAPRVILSLMGYQQSAPSNGNIAFGYDITITTITTTNFKVVQNIYGQGMAYLNYMYLAISSTNTDFFVGQYTQTFDQTSTTKIYSFDIANNANETYANYQTNIIEMKGFLAGYKFMQGTSTSFELNFTLAPKNGSFFTIQVSTNTNSVLQMINYYRIGYDRTTIQRRTYRDVFRDIYFELVNNVNTHNLYNVSWGSVTQFQYRNFLMGTNQISINNAATIGVEFWLYYYFAQSMSLVDLTTPYVKNPAIAKYLYGISFYHSIANCTPVAPDIYFNPTDRKCYSACPTLGYFQDSSSNTCIDCHFTCRTCSAGYLINKCLSCDANYRVFNSSTSTCDCPVQTYDSLVNLTCPSCYASCLTCFSLGFDQCLSCNSTANRQLNTTNSSNVGQCLCKTGYAENSTNQCQSCSTGCLACSFSGNTEVCSSCDTTGHWTLVNAICTCLPNYILTQGKCSQQQCGDGILTPQQQCDDNNVANGDGCSSTCKVETQHVCFQDTNISPYSVCYYNGTINMTITDVSKSLTSNQVSLTIKIDVDSYINENFMKSYLTDAPSIALLDITSRLLLENSRILATSNTVITSTSYDLISKILHVSFTYNQTFDITKKKIKFQPSFSGVNPSIKYFYNSPEAFISLEKTYNKIDTTFYDISEYESVNKLKYAFLGLLIIFWIISFILIAIGKGNIGMEMMVVFQLAWASLLTQGNLGISYAGLITFGKYTAGYNAEFVQNYSKCMKIVGINLSCDLFNNLNISFFLMVLIALIFWGLKLLNKILNDRDERKFLEKKNQKRMQQKYERTEENIIQNLGYSSKQPYQSNMRSIEFESIRRIQENYYKDQQFIPQTVYRVLLDLEFYLCFVTVIIWAMTISFVNQSSPAGIAQTICIPIGYCFIWTFWLMKYFKEDFSFIKAHKRTQNVYDDDQQSQASEQNEARNRQPEPIKKFRIPLSFLRVLIYPIVWLSLLAIGVILALSQPVGYVSEALIIAGSLGFLLLTLLTEMHQQKLHKLRTAVNCIFLILIQCAYILSHSGVISGSGLPIAAIIFVILALVLISNSLATFYLFRIQMMYLKKKKQSNQVKNIQMQVNQIESLKKQKGIKYQDLIMKISDFKSSQRSQSSFEKTIKKEPEFNGSLDNDGSPSKKTARKHIMTKQEINQMFNSNKVVNSQPYVSVSEKQNNQKVLKPVSPKKKLFSPKNFEDLSSMKFQNQNQLKNVQFFPSNKSVTKK